MKIGSVFLELLADGAKLTPQVQAEAQKAGDAAGKTLTQRMSAQLKDNGVKVIGAAFAATAAVMTKGALQMEDAVARIRSETGATAEEAEAIARTSNRIAGDQQQTLDAVADVAIAVKKNLGATGEELDRLTDKTVKFARVTKQDAVGAVEDMDDIVDAYGLSLDDVTTVQDKLIASNQKYGGSVVEMQQALAAMAPQLKALNLGYDDGIELLNLFAASGLDAADGQKALNQAIQKLPPGETLDEFVARLSAVTDDGERARLAIEVFGSKAGAKLANAIKPGIGSLDAFGISAEDAAGKTEQAVDDLDSSLGGRLRKVLSQAKAALRGFGADLGPGITAAAGLASLATSLGIKIPLGPFAKLGKRLGGAIAGGIGAAIVGRAGEGIVADSVADAVTGATKGSRVGGALTRAGKAAGGIFGRAFAAGVLAIPIVIGALVWEWNQSETDKNQQEISDAVAKIIEAGQLEGIKKARAEIVRRKEAFNAGDWFHLDLMGVNKQYDAQIAALDEAAAKFGATGAKIPAATAAGVESGMPAVVNAAHEMYGPFLTEAQAAELAARQTGAAIVDNTAAGIRSRRQSVFDAIDQLKADLKNAMSPMREIGRLTGFLTGKLLARGLKSADPVVRAQAQETRAAAEQRLAELIAGGGKAGKKAGEALKDGLKSKNPAIRAAAQRVKEIVDGKMDQVVTNAGNAGEDAGTAFARRLRIALQTGKFHVNVSTGFVLPDGRASGGPVTAGTPYLVNERTRHSEIVVPSTSGRVLTEAQAIRGLADALGAGGGGTFAPVLNVQGALPVRTTRDVIGEIRRVGELGALLPPRLSPQYPRREAARKV